MLGLIATWIVVLALVLGVGWRSGKTLLEDSTHTHLRYEAQLIADDLTYQVENRLAALQRLAGRLESRRRPDEPRLADELRYNDALIEWFDGLFVTDVRGKIKAAWPNHRRLEGVSIGDREYFRDVRAFRRPRVSGALIGRVSGDPEVVFVAPRLGPQGRFEGLVGGIVKLHGGGFFDRLSRLRLGREGFAAVMTADGTFLYHPDRERILTPVPGPEVNPSLNRALLGWEGESRGPLLSGEMAYQAYRQIWPAGWIVGVALPDEQLLSPLRDLLGRLQRDALLLAMGLLPLVGWLLWLALRPLLHLEAQIEEVGKGRRARVSLNTRMHELQQVAETFNRVEVERSRALARLEDRQAFLDAILASSPAGMFVTDTRGDITYMNPALADLVGISETERHQSEWMRYIHPDDRQAALDLWHFSMSSGEDFLQQYRFDRRGGELLWLEVHARRVSIGERGIGFVGTVKDITQRREEEALRQWEAEHDPLTGLLNRRGFERRLEEALADWRKTGTPSSLILFDLDHFKPINDEGGHALGDEMLRRIAQVVAWEVRRSDHVARQGGDEFAVLLPSCTSDHADKVAQALVRLVGEIGVMHQGREFRVTLSLGLTSFLEGDQRIATVIERADAASYRAKRLGRNRIVAAYDAT
ncbi:diguanylate cyclase domain-containing protein [Halomonas sp. THAF12]